MYIKFSPAILIMSYLDDVGNIEDFHVVLDIINHELKALTFLMLEERPMTITGMRDRINSFLGRPEREARVESKIVYRYLKTIAEAGDGSLAATSTVAGLERGTAITWRLTTLGEWLQPAVAYGMDFLPSRYGISAWEVIGPMNSRFRKRGSHARADIIRSLSAKEPQTLGQLSEVTGLSPAETQYKIYDLFSVASGSECYGDGLPFVEPVDKDMEVHDHVYLWTGKEFDPDDFRFSSSGLQSLAMIFIESGAGSFFRSDSLFPRMEYSKKDGLYKALNILRKRGYVSKTAPKDFKRYRLTAAGKEYGSECIEPIAGYLNGDYDYVDFILRNQPSVEGIVHAANTVKRIMSKA
jgi:hypothetical protein